VSSADVIFTFFNGTWRGARLRPYFPEHRLIEVLARDTRIGRLLVTQVQRSPLHGLAAEVLRRNEASELATPADLYTALTLSAPKPGPPAAIQAWVGRFERSIRRAAARRGLEPVILTASPLVAAWGEFSWARSVVYYAWDDWAVHYNYGEWHEAYRAAYAEIRRRKRSVVAVSEKILERIASEGRSLVVPNGVDPAEWAAPVPPPAWIAALPKPRLLYTGMLDERLDVELIRATARTFPSGSVILVGYNANPSAFDALQSEPNVTVHPPASRSEIVGLTMAAQAFIVPHVRSPLTEAMSPLKVFEALAGGCPVAAVDLPPLCDLDPRVLVAGPEANFPSAVQAAVDLGSVPEPERLGFVERASWAARFEPLIDLLAETATPAVR